VQQDDLRQILTTVATERLALIQRHEAGARVVSHYDFNNTYQYVIAREETHLGWLRDALTDVEAAWPANVATPPVPVVPKPGKQPTLDSVRAHFAAAGLALFKHPERLQLVEQLPRNSVGKVVRGDLARMLSTSVG